MSTKSKTRVLLFLLTLAALWVGVSTSLGADVTDYVSRWTFDNSANLGADATGANNASTVSGVTYTAAGKIGGAAKFVRASANYIEVPYSASLGITAPFTMSAWVNLASLPATGTGGSFGIMGDRFGGDTTFDWKVANANPNYIHADFGNGASWINTSVDITSAQGGQLSVGTWYLITYVVDTTAFRLYINGALKNTIAYSGTPMFMKSGEKLRIGNSSGVEYMDGMIDDVRVYHRALSAGEVSNVFSAALPPVVFTTNPFTVTSAWVGVSYSNSIANSTNDPITSDLTFSKTSGPAWLTVAANGTISGTPQLSDVGSPGANTFGIHVTSSANSSSADGTMNINVANPFIAFTANPFTVRPATIGQPYSASIANSTSDPVTSELTFSQTGTWPAWLHLAANGALTGTPAASDKGPLSVGVHVLGAGGATADATMNITVTLDVMDYVSRWTFDDSTHLGADLTGANPATATLNAVPNPLGVQGGCVSLANGDLVVPYSTSLALHTYTLSTWVKLAAPVPAAGYGLFDTRYNTGSGANVTMDLKIVPTSDGLHSYIHGDFGTGASWINTGVDILATDFGTTTNTTHVSGQLTAGNWYLITYVVDTSAFRLYINGDLKHTYTFAGQTPLLINPKGIFAIGRSDGTIATPFKFMNGLMDDVRVYGRALSTTEVADVYDAGVVPAIASVTPANGAVYATGAPTAVNVTFNWPVTGVGALTLSGGASSGAFTTTDNITYTWTPNRMLNVAGAMSLSLDTSAVHETVSGLNETDVSPSYAWSFSVAPASTQSLSVKSSSPPMGGSAGVLGPVTVVFSKPVGSLSGVGNPQAGDLTWNASSSALTFLATTVTPSGTPPIDTWVFDGPWEGNLALIGQFQPINITLNGMDTPSHSHIVATDGSGCPLTAWTWNYVWTPVPAAVPSKIWALYE